MTVSSSTSRIEYTGDAVTTAFSFPYYFLANGDLKVYLNGVLQTITTHYTVAGAGVGAGGTVTFVTAPPSGQLVVIYREVAITQQVDYTPNDPFPANTHEQALDRLTMIAQQHDEEIGRALLLPSTSTYSELTVPDPVANNFLQWNAGATALQNASSVYGTVTVNTTAPLTGGGQLNADKTFGISAASGGAAGSMSAADFTKLAGIEAAADVTDATNVNAAGAVMHSDVTPSDGLLRKTGAETYTTLKINTAATTTPGITDDSASGYGVGSTWINVTTDNGYICLDSTVGAAVWALMATTSGAVASVLGTAPVASSGGANPNISLNDDGVTNAKLANMDTQRIKGRTTAGTGDPEDLTAAQVSTMLGTVATQAGAETLINKTLTSPVLNSPALNGTLSGTAFLDEDAMTSNSAIATVSQQSLVSYVQSFFAVGPWTPTILDSSYSASEGQTYSTQVGWYAKAGKIVFFQFNITLTSIGTLTGADPAHMGGLPFVALVEGGGGSLIHAGGSVNVANASGQGIQLSVISGTTTLSFRQMTPGTSLSAAVTITEIGGTAVLQGSGVYRTS